MKQIEYDDLSDDDKKIYREVALIRDRNAAVVAEIEQLGGSVDLTTARVEHLIASLETMGLITVTDILKMQKDWELSLKPQVREMRDRMRALRAEAQKAAREKKLILPPGMQNGNG